MHYSYGMEKDKKNLNTLNANLIQGIETLDAKKVKEALEAGANSNYRDENGTSALYLAMFKFICSYNDPQPLKVSSEIVQRLLKSGANIRQESKVLYSQDVNDVITPLELVYSSIRNGDVLRGPCFDKIFEQIDPKNQRSFDLYTLKTRDLIRFNHRLEKDLYLLSYKLGFPDIGAPFNYQTNEAANSSSFKINEAPLCFEDKQLYGRGHGTDENTGLDLFKKSLENYFLQMDFNDPSMNIVKLIHKQLPNEIKTYELYQQEKALEKSEEYVKKIKNDELVIIPSGWRTETSGHSITLAIWHGYLVVSNKGAGGDIIGPCQIFPLKNKNLSPQDLQGIVSGMNQKKVLKDILNLVIEDEVINLPANFQKYGTCVYTNKKNIIRGIFFLENLGSKKWTELGQNEKDDLIEKTQKQYKQYQQHDRNSYINALIMLANLASELGKKEDVKIFLTELSFYMIWHCDDLKEFKSYSNIIEPLTKENKLTLMELICHPDRKLSISELMTTAEPTWAEQIKNEIYLTALKLKIHDKISLDRSKNIFEHLEFISSQFTLLDLDITDTLNNHLLGALLNSDEKTTVGILSLPAFSKKKFEETYPFSIIGYALMSQNLDLLEKVLSFCNPTEINSLQKNGTTPLLQAIEGDYRPELIAFLIKKGASINLADKDGKTPFMAATEGNDPDILALLINSVTVEKLTEDQCRKALFALTKSNSHTALVKQLIDYNIDLNKQEDDITLIQQAVLYNNQEMLKILLEQPNIDVNIENEISSPILMSISLDNKDMFELLLQHGAKIDKDKTIVSDFLERHNISKSTPAPSNVKK